MNKIIKRYRDYKKSQEYEGELPYSHSHTGFLFHSEDELNKFTDCDDMFEMDLSV